MVGWLPMVLAGGGDKHDGRIKYCQCCTYLVLRVHAAQNGGAQLGMAGKNDAV